MTDPPNPNDLLHKEPKRQTTFSLPLLVSERADDLCSVLNAEGKVGTIYRQELVAALIGLASEDVGDLEEIISDYRNLKVRDARVGSDKGANVIELRPVKPGRRVQP
jgi:hypothetical protein